MGEVEDHARTRCVEAHRVRGLRRRQDADWMDASGMNKLCARLGALAHVPSDVLRFYVSHRTIIFVIQTRGIGAYLRACA